MDLSMLIIDSIGRLAAFLVNDKEVAQALSVARFLRSP